MFGRSTGGFDRLVEKATSQLLLEPDWDSILQICDSIRQGDVQPKYAVQAIRRKIYSENPHVSMFALQCLESSVKNCGQLVHNEVATKDFMEFFKDLVKVRNDPVRAKILELVQIWSHAFRNEPSYKVVQDTYHLMKMEGYPFPQLKEADAMFMAEKAPEWKDGDCCHRCRVQFTMVQRKHHCRNCGQVFCNKCSSKNSIIPKYGIEREVRVCEACFDTLSKSIGEGGKKDSEDDLPAEYLASPLSRQSQAPPARSEQELQEEEELQLALALSQSEAETKNKDRGKRTNYPLYGNTTTSETSTTSEFTHAPTQPAQQVTAPVIDTSDMDPELARYLNRNYWQQKHEEIKTTTTQPSAPAAASDTKTVTSGITTGHVAENYQNGEVTQSGNDQEEFLNALRSSIEIFVNRMKSNSLRGRSIANDSSVQTLFMTINQMHPQLIKYMGEQEDARAHYEGLQDKLAQMKDAREALDALRDEHREKRRREMEELERQRQIQMAQKLEIMRQKKQEYLEYQRQLALQRMQEQEREMQMRLEQQKQMAQMRAMQQYYPQVYGPPVPGQPMAGYSPAGSAEGSPLHHPHPAPMAGPYVQPGMGAPPGQVPAPTPGALQSQANPAGAQAPGSTAGAPQSVYPGYNQISMGQPPPSFQGPPAPGAYQPPPGPTPGGAFPAGQYQPPASTQPPHIQQGPPPAQGYSTAAPTQPMPGMEYASYNMQSMAGALPPQGQPQGQPQFSQPGGPPAAPQPGAPQSGPPVQGQQYMPPPPQGQYAPPGQPGGVLPPGVAPADGMPQQQSQDAQLICFD